MRLNPSGPPGADVGFAERLLEVIDSGRRTATYKLAVLIALLDLCARHSAADGRARAAVTRDIAEQVAGLYWPQVIPYRLPGSGGAVELCQITLPGPRLSPRSARSAARPMPRGRHRGIWHVTGCLVTTS